ncbi:hypothetical protein [Aureivirga marina]|uniref:hypothetical protein n=1 Tax=Aureivirga marina TaxID=1182451 RepID=UPI0018CAEEF8|nr:hypothetical protein [Aureivirga marina]
MKRKTLKQLYGLIPVIILVLIQIFDKEDKFLYLQFGLLGIMVLFFVYITIKRSTE